MSLSSRISLPDIPISIKQKLLKREQLIAYEKTVLLEDGLTG